MYDADVVRVPMASPGDVSGIADLFNKGKLAPEHVKAVFAQTEGDGYARGYASQSMEILLSEHLGWPRSRVNAEIPFLMIGGTAGIMHPHWNLFVRRPPEGKARPRGKRLALGVRTSRVLAPEEYGTMRMVQVVAETTRAAMKHAGVASGRDVHCVEVKCPAMTPARVQDAQQRGKKVVNTNPVAASSMAKGASALGVALALGEVPRGKLNDAAICRNWNLYSEVASTSAGGEQVACRVIVIGNSSQSVSDLVSGHGVMGDQLDLEGAYRAFRSAGLPVKDGTVVPADRKRVAAVFVNAGADFAPAVGGRRHTMHSDFLWSYSGWQAKAIAHALVSAIVGDTMVLASAGAEHQGPPGANLICVIARAT